MEREMLILGIDTSCDDTSASLIEASEGSLRVISNIVSSQSEIHVKYGGIVPELASRRHIEMIWPVVEEALSGIRLKELSAVAVCNGPGLIGSLLVGSSFAKAMCYASGIPLVGVNHLEGHILSVFLSGNSPVFPFLSLIVSGGHTSLYKIDGFGKYEEVGRTRDDAAGEAYDKVSKLMGLGYPGGPVIDRMAKEGNPGAVALPRAYLPETLDFSFSGLKTAVLNTMNKQKAATEEFLKDVAASFQASVTDVLARKTEWAMRRYDITRVAISGGVAANSGLREKMAGMVKEMGGELYVPEFQYCTDNAAMIAFAGYHRFLKGELAGLALNPRAYLPL